VTTITTESEKKIERLGSLSHENLPEKAMGAASFRAKRSKKKSSPGRIGRQVPTRTLLGGILKELKSAVNLKGAERGQCAQDGRNGGNSEIARRGGDKPERGMCGGKD